jgi:hypothetical protein
MSMISRTSPTLAAVAAAALMAALALGAADANAASRNKPKVVKAVASAPATGGLAIATASCPKGSGPKGPLRAVSGGFVLQQGDGIVFESRRVGQNSWRASAQSFTGAITLTAYANCQRGVPKLKAVSSTVPTPGVAQVGPAATAKCGTGSAVAGGFATPAPLTPMGPRNVVIGSFPTGKRAWQAQALSNLDSTVTSFVYCAKRSKPKIKNAVPDSGSTVTAPGALAVSTTGLCKAAQLSPGGGGFRQTGATATQFLIPVRSSQRPSSPSSSKPLPPGYHGNVWQAHGRKVGDGTPVTIAAVALCG